MSETSLRLIYFKETIYAPSCCEHRQRDIEKLSHVVASSLLEVSSRSRTKYPYNQKKVSRMKFLACTALSGIVLYLYMRMNMTLSCHSLNRHSCTELSSMCTAAGISNLSIGTWIIGSFPLSPIHLSSRCHM